MTWKCTVTNRILSLSMAAVLAGGVSVAGQRAGPRKSATTGAGTAVAARIGLQRGVWAVIELPRDGTARSVIDLTRDNGLIVYFQSSDAAQVAAVRRAAAAAGLLGTRLFADTGDCRSIHLADNVADRVLVGPAAEAALPRSELLRILHPEAKAVIGDKQITKPFPEGIDDWSHPYHGPDNNPLSRDQLARWPYLTQFLAKPLFCPMPEVSVAAAGRVFRAFGHIAHKANQNAWLNTLLGINGYNGTVLWRRRLHEGFVIHRNTMIATPDTLYLADDESCKLIDARTGQLKGQIVVPDGVADGPVWKWMALQDGTLYALVGGPEVKVATRRSNVPGLGHWPWGMWQGHDYKDPKTNLGFGRTFLAVDPVSKQVRWTHREQDYIDSRGVCMGQGRIYFYSPQKFLGCLEAATGKVLWKNSDRDLLAAIGPDGRAQHYVTGYATTAFIKCNDKYVFFAGPQRSRLVVASAEDGKLVWQHDVGNLHLILRDDCLYAAGPAQTGCKLSYDSGRVLAHLPRRRACTRATGSVDSIFYRTPGGTVRIDLASNTAQHIAPMRPPCQDGVIISHGLLYWGPWMCGCQLSLYGHICLGPAGDFDYHPPVTAARLHRESGDLKQVAPLEVKPGDWPCYLGDNARTAVAKAALPKSVNQGWSVRAPGGGRPTATIAAGGLVFGADTSGAVWALAADSGKLRWISYTAGPVFFPPALWHGRLYVGSADGRVYALEAASGRPLWSFQAAPAQRWIPVYGRLMSRWPVAGGVAVADGVVYAAAGIAHYDGTYVYALDAVTGAVKWCNDTSGTLAPKVHCGVSLQGNLYIQDGELRFLGGGAYEIARYDLRTGKCLNQPREEVTSRFHTAFYPYFPYYGQYLSLDHTLADGRQLVYDASYEGSRHSRLALLEPLPAGTPKPHKEASRWYWLLRRGRRQQRQKAVWQDRQGRIFNGFIVGRDLLVAAGKSGGPARSPALWAVAIRDGSELWSVKLPAAAVKGGLAVDGAGRILVSLQNGQLLCFTPAAAAGN